MEQGYSGLLTFQVNKTIDRAASFGLHEDVSAFERGSIVPPDSAADLIKPSIIFATEQGRIGIVGQLTSGATKTLSDLQRNMAAYHEGPGGVQWRT